jgi:hypothetical protein
MKYRIKSNKNISLILILFFISIWCVAAILSVDVFSVDLLFAIVWGILSIIIIYKLIKNIGCYVLLYDDYICVKNKSKELIIKLIDITQIDTWFIIKPPYIVINYGDDNQIQIEYLKSLYLDLNEKLKKINEVEHL